MRRKLLIGLTLINLSHFAGGVTIRDSTSADGNRFLNFPENPTPNPEFIFSGFDLSGVGWADDGNFFRSVTMVSPKHFVYAAHFRLGIGTTLNFSNVQGQIYQGEILMNHAQLFAADPSGPIGGMIESDILLGELTEAIPESAGINHLPYLNNPTDLSNLEFYQQAEFSSLIVFGQGQRAGTGTTENWNLSPVWTEPWYHYQYNVDGGLASDALLKGGDSGSPTLIVVDGKPALVSTHSGALRQSDGDQVIIDSFLGHGPVVDQINEQMSVSGYRLEEAIPEATVGGMVLVSLVVVLFMRKNVTQIRDDQRDDT